MVKLSNLWKKLPQARPSQDQKLHHNEDKLQFFMSIRIAKYKSLEKDEHL